MTAQRYEQALELADSAEELVRLAETAVEAADNYLKRDLAPLSWVRLADASPALALGGGQIAVDPDGWAQDLRAGFPLVTERQS